MKDQSQGLGGEVRVGRECWGELGGQLLSSELRSDLDHWAGESQSGSLKMV